MKTHQPPEIRHATVGITINGRTGDLLVDGTTDRDADDVALLAVVNEWKARPNATGRANILNQQGLKVANDADRDVVYGSSTTNAVDWFFTALTDVMMRKEAVDLLR